MKKMNKYCVLPGEITHSNAFSHFMYFYSSTYSLLKAHNIPKYKIPSKLDLLLFLIQCCKKALYLDNKATNQLIPKNH